METRMNHFSINEFLLLKRATFQGLSPILNQQQRDDLSFRAGKAMGVKMGASFLSDMPPFEEFKRRISEIVERLMLGIVDEVDARIPFLQEARFVFCVSRSMREEDSVYTQWHKVKESGEIDLCYFKAGLFSGLMKYYLNRENVTKEISCGDGDDGRGICQFEIVVP